MSTTTASPSISPNKPTTVVQPVPTVLFLLYCYFLIDYFVHTAVRIPAYGAIRPTLLLALIICLALTTQGPALRRAFRDQRLQTIVALLAYIVLSLPLVEWPGSVVRENYQPFVKAVLFLFFTAIIVDTDKRLKIAVLLFTALQAFRVLEPLYLNLTEGYLGSQTHLAAGGFAGRLQGAPADVVNGNGLGFVIATAFAFSHFLLWRGRSKILKLIYLGLVPAYVYALVLTASRGGLIAFAIAGFFIFRESRHKAFLAIVAIAVAIGAWGQMSGFHKARYRSLVSTDTAQHRSVTGRFEGMLQELELGLDRPIFGHGLGTTPETKANLLGERQAAHNLYTELLIEIGAIGLGIFLWYLWLIYRGVRSNRATFRQLERSGKHVPLFHYRLNQALLTTFWMYAVYSFNYYGLSREYWYLFGGFCIAFAAALNRLLKAHEETAAELGEPAATPAARRARHA